MYGRYGDISVDGKIINVKDLNNAECKRLYDIYDMLDNELENVIDTLCLYSDVDADRDYVIHSLRSTVSSVLSWLDNRKNKTDAEAYAAMLQDGHGGIEG